MTAADRPVVFVVDDDPTICEMYERYLEDRYEVRTATDGGEALERLDESVDVVLLDRRMPGVDGDRTLEAIRETGYDCRVAMVTAVAPDTGIVEMGFDEYVLKPTERDELVGTVEKLLSRSRLDDDLQEYYSLVARRVAIESELNPVELDNSTEYRELLARIDEHRETVHASLGDMSSDEAFIGSIREIARASNTDPPDRTDGDT